MNITVHKYAVGDWLNDVQFINAPNEYEAVKKFLKSAKKIEKVTSLTFSKRNINNTINDLGSKFYACKVTPELMKTIDTYRECLDRATCLGKYPGTIHFG